MKKTNISASLVTFLPLKKDNEDCTCDYDTGLTYAKCCLLQFLGLFLQHMRVYPRVSGLSQ